MTNRDFQEWEEGVSSSEKTDAIWRVEAYRLSRYFISHAREDARTLYALPLGRPLVSQLWRSAGSIAANIAEGYSRGTGADRARFYEYALGSARECIVWYEATRDILDDIVITERVGVLVQVKRLLLSTLPMTRRTTVRT